MLPIAWYLYQLPTAFLLITLRGLGAVEGLVVGVWVGAKVEVLVGCDVG